jgi:3-oxoadipyl-CoA thiolase
VPQAVIVDAIRTPIANYAGALSSERPDDLAALVIRTLVKRNSLPPEEIEDVYFGCGNQAGEDNRNIARMALLLAGLPPSVPGVTVNRLCGSGLEAIRQAVHDVQTGNGDLFVAGGVESMSRAPYVTSKQEYAFKSGDLVSYDTTIGWRFVNPRMEKEYPPLSMGQTAENLAEMYKISREEQDEFALKSNQKAVKASEDGVFQEEIVPVPVRDHEGSKLVTKDEHPRPDTSLEKLSKLKPVFKEGGTVTAGNSSGVSDGAAGVVVMSEAKAKEIGVKPLAAVLSSGVAGVHPSCMGLGPAPASKKALKRAKLSLDEINAIELNEAFAAQVLSVLKEIDFDPSMMNPHGGAIALGHPIGCSGARVATTLLHEMKRRNREHGLATLCIGVGQGIAMTFERA